MKYIGLLILIVIMIVGLERIQTRNCTPEQVDKVHLETIHRNGGYVGQNVGEM